SFYGYRTFTWRAHPECEDPAIERHLALIARGLFEGHGYTYVDSPEADFTVVLLYKNDRGVRRRPERRVKVPLSDKAGEFAYVTFDGVEVTGSTSVTYTPEVYLFCIDNKRAAAGQRERAVVWEGCNLAASNVADVRLTGQLLIWYMDDWVTNCLPVTVYLPEVRAGFSLAIASPRGQTFHPMIFSILSNAREHEIPLLRWDIITAINGVATEGKSVPQVRELVENGPADKVSVTVRRGPSTKTFVIPRPPKAEPGSIPLPPMAQPYADY
ncbi:MAG: hypothetical protein JXA57_03485, partial [Armatimonadetes bacterium]|nr:hypothetical protein [Armatimonadota bacterium]